MRDDLNCSIWNVLWYVCLMAFCGMLLIAGLITVSALASGSAHADTYGTFTATEIRVKDGDTFQTKLHVLPGLDINTAIRIIGVDTPELHGKCPKEINAANKAKDYLGSLLNGSTVTLVEIKEDLYAGRLDAVVFANGEKVSDKIIANGFGVPLVTNKRTKNWCADL